MSKVLKPGTKVRRICQTYSYLDHITAGKIYKVIKLGEFPLEFYVHDDRGKIRESFLGNPPKLLFWEIVEDEFIPDKEYEGLYE